jgi:hypothetical protein
LLRLEKLVGFAHALPDSVDVLSFEGFLKPLGLFQKFFILVLELAPDIWFIGALENQLREGMTRPLHGPCFRWLLHDFVLLPTANAQPA